MKKTLAILMALAFVASAASAQVKVELDSANKVNFFTYNDNDGDVSTGQFKYISENRFFLKYTSEDKTFGANFTPRFNLGAASTSTAYEYDVISGQIDVDGSGVIDADDEGTVTSSLYNGFYRIEWDAWTKIGEVAMVKFGNFDNRVANRVTTNASSFNVFEMAKLGYLTLGTKAKATDDKLGLKQTEGDYLAQAGNSNVNALLEVYAGPATIDFAIRNKKGSTNYNEYKNNWGLRVFGSVPDMVKLTASVTTDDVGYETIDVADTSKLDHIVLGFYAEPLMVENLTLTLGYTAGGIYLETEGKDAIHGLSVRGNYAMMEKALNVTFATDYTLSDGENAMYNMVNVAYNLGTITPALYFARYADSTSDTSAIMIAPRVTTAISKTVSFDFGPEFRVGEKVTNIQFPCNLRIQVK